MSKLLSSRLTLLLSFAVVLLVGCGGNTSDLRQWMDETRRNTKVSVKPLPEPKKFEPFYYVVNGRVEPYDPSKLDAGIVKAVRTGGGVQPDLERKRELLEGHPLDSLFMVGTLQKGNNIEALVRESGGMVHRVHVGNYLGTNMGRVVKITESDIQLKETVQDASGEWVERETKLELQEVQ